MVILSYFFDAKNTHKSTGMKYESSEQHSNASISQFSYLMWSVVQCHVSRWAHGTQARHRWERQSVGVRSTVDLLRLTCTLIKLHTRRTAAAPPALMSKLTLLGVIWGSVCVGRVRLGRFACDRFTRGKRSAAKSVHYRIASHQFKRQSLPAGKVRWKGVECVYMHQNLI